MARDVNNLGMVLKAQGDLEGAKRCFERALAIDEKALGPEHTNVAINVNNLGSVLKAQGDLEGAKRCFREGAGHRREGPRPGAHQRGHEMSTTSASVLQAQGDLEGAKKCCQRVLAIFEKRLGKDHPNTILVRNNLQSLQK